jgi:hypothetical protein
MADKDDLSLLPEDVRARARIAANGEVSWPIADAGTAIESLADAGLVILGIDVQRYDDQGHTWETAWSDFSTTDCYGQAQVGDRSALIEASRLHALHALARDETADFGDWIRVSWQPAPLPL